MRCKSRNKIQSLRALSNVLTNSLQEPVSGQACITLSILIIFFLLSLVRAFYGPWYQSGPFPLINVGSGSSLPAFSPPLLFTHMANNTIVLHGQYVTWP